MKNFKTHPLMKIINSTFIDMPSPSNLSFYWNFGSLLGIMLIMQILTGLIMTFHFSSDETLAFPSIIMNSRNITNFWLMRWLHANGASFMFLLMFFHLARNMYYYSFKKSETWLTGMLIFVLTSVIAFLGYVLPWGQMSYWGVTVITNLLTVIPYIGQDIINWLWGNYSVSNSTIKRFYSLHFILPFILLMLVIIHLLFLHQYGSSNPLGLQNNKNMLYFHPFFITKDILGLLILLLWFLFTTFNFPLIFNDPENFIYANPLITPTHIQPEWYFLFAYAILRSIPNKIGGVIALISSIVILFTLPMIHYNKIPMKFNPLKKMIFWTFITSFIILTWIGMNPVSYPFTLIGSIFSFLYFLLIILLFI